MPTKIRIGKALVDDAELDIDAYLEDAGFTVASRSRGGAFFNIELSENLNDAQKDQLAADLGVRLMLIETDVSDVSEAEVATKKRYMRVMDRCTERRLRLGFSFQGSTFAMDARAQVRALSLFVNRTALSYPFFIADIENTGGVQIDTAIEMLDFYQALHVALTTIEQSGITGKLTVRNATGRGGARTAAENYLTTHGCDHMIPELGT